MQPIYLTRAVVDRFERLVLLVFSFVPIYVTLSMSYESFFYLFFSTLVVLWVLFEPKPSTSRVTFQGLVQEEEDLIAKEKAEKEGRAFIVEVPKTPIKPATLGVQDLRRACIVLVFLHLAFFGTGNVASVSSFYLEPVYRLVPVFSPFLMATLLLYKIMIPFSILASSVTILNRELNLPTFAIFLVALCVSDVLTLNFFWLVKDEGSWLDIGQSISHFAISNLLLMFCGILNLIGAWLMQ